MIQYVKKGLKERQSMCKDRVEFIQNHHPLREAAKRWDGGAAPVVVHILNLSLHVAVNAFAVSAVCQLSHHAQPIRPLFTSKKLLDRHDDALSTPLSVNAHHLLTQGHLWWSWGSFFGFTPSSFQRPGGEEMRLLKNSKWYGIRD